MDLHILLNYYISKFFISYQSSSGIKTADNTGFDIFPNPVDDNLFVTLNKPAGDKTEILILDVLSQLVKTITITKGTKNLKIDMQKLVSGIYYIKVTSGNMMSIRKIIRK